MIENMNPAYEAVSRVAEQTAVDGAGSIMAFSSFTGDFFHVEKNHPVDKRVIGFVCGAAMPLELLDDEESRQKIEALARDIHELCAKHGLTPSENSYEDEPQEEAPQPEAQPVE